jgi:hypothetical protein
MTPTFHRGAACLLLFGLGAAGTIAACGSDESRRLAADEGTAGETNLGGGGDLIGAGGAELVAPDSGIGGAAVRATGLVFDPPTVALVLDGKTTKTASYALSATLLDGTVQAVAAEAMEFDRPDVASYANGSPVVLTATGLAVGMGKLHAVYGGLEATATLAVSIVQSDVLGTVPQNAIDALNAGGLPADTALTKLLYPYDATVFPLGIASPLIMWNGPNASDAYRIHLEETGYAYDLFAITSAKAQVRVPQEVWDRMTASNQGDKVTLTVSRWDANTKTAATSVIQSWTIAPESLRGAIYYWAASQVGSNRVGSVTRVFPGIGSTPERLNAGRCMGCHSVSADGSRLVATVEDPTAPSLSPYRNWTGYRAWASFSLPDATLLKQTTMNGANSALTPNGKYVVFGGRSNPPTAGSKYLSLGVTDTGDLIAQSGLDDMVAENSSDSNTTFMMPAFSIDGTKLALVEAHALDPNDNVLPEPANRIVYVNFDASVPKFDPTLHEIVRASAFPSNDAGLGYPAFTPDSQYVAFHTGQWATGCHDGCNDSSPDSGELWIHKVDGGSSIRLTNLDDPPAAADRMVHREPTFCPVQRGGYAWVVFTSMRDWGNQLTGPAINGKRRLWVAAVDAAIGTTDPSHPAFYVDGQEDTPNMRGYWALAACIEAPKPGNTAPKCKAGFECCSGFCVGEQCVDITKLTCAGVGEACSETVGCCNQAVTDCVDGVCKVRDIAR